MKHLLSIADLGADGIADLLTLTDSFVEISSRSIPKVPVLRGKTVASLFFEDSTRTRLSFETAARRLSADVISFSVSTSSLNKGESVRDTVETIEAMGVDALVVRHGCAGVPQQITSWFEGSVINAGDGWHEHPTQALLDTYTIRQHRGSLRGLRVLIVGDVKHSRVARSNMEAFTMLGASVTLVAPGTLLPPNTKSWPVETSHDLDACLGDADIVYLLRMQQERQEDALVPSLREYATDFGLDRGRMARLSPDALVMHPGPMNRGVEIAADVVEDPRCVVIDQVRNGVPVRMAVLFLLLGSNSHLAEAHSGEPDETGRPKGSRIDA